MGILQRLTAGWRGFKDAGTGNARYDQLAAWVEVYGGRQSKSGQTVTPATALQVSTVLGCVKVLAEGLAQPALKLYRERPEGGADPATEHPLYRVLYRRPNPWQTSFAFRETMMYRAALEGNFYAFKNRVGREVRELLPIPGRVQVKQNSDLTLSYRVEMPDGTWRDIAADDIWHVRGPSWNSWLGLEAVQVARDVIGLAMAIEQDQSKLYKNGLRQSGVYSMEGTLNAEQYKDLRKFIEDHQASEGGPLILDRSAKFSSEVMTSVDAQTLESRRLQVEEICRMFRVMPIMIGHSDKTATYASAEQMFLAHVVHTLSPWCERIEQSIDNDLLTHADRAAGLYAKFNLNTLQRGAFETRMNGYAKALGTGGSPAWMTPNEVRALEEMNPLKGGDELPKPTNVAPAPSGDAKP
ncbi:HK97 family phage portal protein [Bradyrhizobium sp. LM2.7]